MSLCIDDIFTIAGKTINRTSKAIEEHLENADLTNQADLLYAQKLMAENQISNQAFSALINDVKEMEQTIAKNL